MIVYITRHGQPTQSENAVYTPGDPPLSELGGEQATLLGQRLRSMDFQGTIFSSPYLRTTQTANLIARELDTTFQLAPAMREYTGKSLRTFTGNTLEQLRQVCDRIAVDAVLPYPWWTVELEDALAVRRRVGPFLDELIETHPGDVLLVGHGASVGAVVHCLLREKAPEALDQAGPGWNCLLSALRVKPTVEELFLNNADHLPRQMTTSNAVTYEEAWASWRQ